VSASVDGGELDAYSDGELEEERDFLLTSLTDLEAERGAGDVDDGDYAVLRDGYTARAAVVLRALDRRRVEQELATRPASAAAGGGEEPAGGAVGPVTREMGAGTRRWRWKKPLTVGAIAALAVAAGLGVAGAAGQRLPGDTSSGSVPNDKAHQLLALAVQQFQKGNVLGSIRTYDQVLAADPANSEALTYKGWLLALAGAQGKDTGLIDQGLSSIQEAERVAPSYADPHFFGGEIYLRDKNDPKDAITEFETYLADNPPADMGPEVQGELAAAQAAVKGVPLPGESVTPVRPGGATAPPASPTTR
jgi:tetratricopeptide (TPR) repeat protein